MRFISAVALAVCSLAVNGQDFVVTNRLDTLPGKVLIRSYPNMDKVQLNTQEKKKEYAATALSTVFLDRQIYRPVLVTDGFRLLKLERSGMVSLYMGRQSPGTPYNIPFLVKRSGESLEVTVLRFKNTMTKFLSDCSSIKQKIEEGKYADNRKTGQWIEYYCNSNMKNKNGATPILSAVFSPYPVPKKT